MAVDLLDHLLILGASWRWIVATAMLSVGATVAVSLAWPPAEAAAPIAVLDYEAIAREERMREELIRIKATLEPHQNEFWAAWEHLRLTEVRLRALREPLGKVPPRPAPWGLRLVASILGGAFLGAVWVGIDAYVRASNHERPLKARVFDLRERGYIR